jgi:hypothetical protein
MLETVLIESFSERLWRRLRTLTRKLKVAARRLVKPVEKAASARTLVEPQILTVSADVGFYSSVLNAANSCGWRAEWARSMKRGVELCRTGFTPIVIYDRNLPGVDWRSAVDQLSRAAAKGRVLLAAPEIDEDLWRTVLHRHGYDVLTRSADAEQLKRELRFAWLSLQEYADQEPYSLVSHDPGVRG